MAIRIPVTSFAIKSTLHLRDEWNTLVDTNSPSYALTSQLHLRDTVLREVVDNATSDPNFAIESILHLRDTLVRGVGSNAASFALTSQLHLRDEYVRTVETGEVFNLFSRLHLRDEVVPKDSTIAIGIGQNISFGETKEPGYEGFSHRFRWTNLNGKAVPDLNYKDLKEPITRIIPAPSFLQFKYDNSFLIFTRNSINRFLLDPDTETDQWRAQTDNLIEEFRDLGLMEPKTLVLAADTLFGLSEKGVWMWNKEGMRLISEKIIDIPDAGVYEYVGFYCSIRNQYILHRQGNNASVYQMTNSLPVSTVKSNQNSETVFLTDTKFVSIKNESVGAGYPDDVYVVVGEIKDDLPVYGTPVLVGSCKASIHIIPMGVDKVIISYNLNSGTQKLKLGSINKKAIALSNVVTVTGAADNYGFLVKFSDTKFALFHNSTDYYTGTLASNGAITLGTEQSNWVAPSMAKFKGAYVADGKAFIMYVVGGGSNAFFRIITDNGDGTMTFGTVYDTSILALAFETPDVVVVSESLVFCAWHDGTLGDTLQYQPFAISGTTLTGGLLRGFLGITTQQKLALAGDGSTGFWLFWEDTGNSNYLVAMWGDGDADAMQVYLDTKRIVQLAQTGTVEAIEIPDGRALLVYNDDGTTSAEGLTAVWGTLINTFVYQIDRDVWGKFLGIDILDIPVVLSGGNLDENYNLMLDSNRELQKYPGSTITSAEAYIRTKEFYIKKGVFQRWLVDFEGADVDVETRVKRVVGALQTELTDLKTDVTANKLRGISLSKQRGRTMSIKIVDAEIIKSLSFDFKKWGEQ